ncbi:hypothetical protein GOEFS_040_00090 [Gordonia effusa NBRC 100432]|uniref:Uncharacterized protein n=1 Tax=Gordonia effusa NBRC 100432 TaxID=1077974 RepID=H0QYD8_9ACTN|nr:hypothetical protein [Gordonia effusa]GAB17839.1 hypothetical protein GOEFS_040_00090 [Gordonia effusa NBRC 100432]
MTTDPHSPLPEAATPRLWRRYEAWRTRMHDTFVRKNGHRLPTWHNRRGARRAARLLILNLLLILISSVVAYFSWWFSIPFVIGIVGCIAWQYVLRIVSGSIADTPAPALDEFQLAKRNAARSISFGILVGLMFVPYFILILLSSWHDDGVPSQYVYGAAITQVALLLTGTMIPTLLTAWWTSDPDPEDFDSTDFESEPR